MNDYLSAFSRRQFVNGLACGIGGVGLSTLLADDVLADAASPTKTHHEPRAKSLIFLNMQGGPSQFETFTYKPALNENAGKEVKVEGARNAGNFIMPHAFKMNQHGAAGHYASELFPHMATVMDELCIIESMYSEDNNHPGAQREVLTGFNRRPMPCFGAWISYGLGKANENLPAFVYLANGHHHGSAFLPAQYQGMPLGKGLRNIRPYLSRDEQRAQLDLMSELTRMQITQRDDASELNARIEAAELAFRMQMSAPEAVDLSQETAQTLEMYGVTGTKKLPRLSRTLSESTADFATMCLTARRLVERGVRVISISVGGRRGWDQHGNLRDGLKHNASVVDQPIAALLKDLRERGLLDSTLVLWGGEFGRTPTAENAEETDGRAHHPRGYTMWLAGGGVKPGFTYGKTNELGTKIAENKVHIHDLHATLLWLMGLDHRKLTYRYGGRDQTIADIHGKVVDGIFAWLHYYLSKYFPSPQGEGRGEGFGTGTFNRMKRMTSKRCKRILLGFVAFGVIASGGLFADDREALIGAWKITVFQDDGKDRLSRLGAGPATKGKEPRIAKLVFTAQECYLIRGDGRREMASGLSNAGWKSCTLDESTTPKSIDIVGFAGKDNQKAKTYLGIYELDGDKLRICYSETSPQRPTKFESNGHDNLFECQQIAKEPEPVPE